MKYIQIQIMPLPRRWVLYTVVHRSMYSDDTLFKLVYMINGIIVIKEIVIL